MLLDSVIPYTMKNSHLIPEGKQLSIMSGHTAISSSVQKRVFCTEGSWFSSG